MSKRLPVRKTYKLYIGGAFPRSESGRTYEAEGQNVARASRKDARDAVKAARGRVPGLGLCHRLQPWPGAVPPRRDDGGTRVQTSPRPAPAARRSRAAIDRDRLVRRLGGQAAAGARGLESRLRAVLQLHGSRADGRRRDRRARLNPRYSGSSPGLRRRSSAATVVVVVASELRPARGNRARRGDCDVRPSRRCRQRAHGLRAPSSLRCSPGTWT